MGWHAALRLDYRRDGERTVGHHAHEGPLRVLKALYPEGPALCQHVIVHPPAGIVGGDRLDITLALGEGAQTLITTPGATRFYRSAGPLAEQAVEARLKAGARLEWLPSETIVYDGALASNRLAFHLEAGAEMIGCDLLALGLPASSVPFAHGAIHQRIAVRAGDALVWLEQGRIAADDQRLLQSPLGLAGHTVLGSLWWAAGSAGSADDAARLDSALNAARELQREGVLGGASLLHDRLLVWRGLAQRVEPLQQAMRALRGRWRQLLWRQPVVDPRVWST